MSQHTETPLPITSENVNNLLGLSDYISLSLPLFLGTLLFFLKRTGDTKRQLEELVSFVKADALQFERVLPAHYLERLDQILSQIAVLGGYDRVFLGIFHNGVVGAKYSKFDSLAIAASFGGAGIEDIPELNQNIPVKRIQLDLHLIRENGGSFKLNTEEYTNLDSMCYMYLKNRRIFQLETHLLCIGTLDLGLLAFHHCSPNVPEISGYNIKRIAELKRELSSIIDVYAKTKRKVEGPGSPWLQGK